MAGDGSGEQPTKGLLRGVCCNEIESSRTKAMVIVKVSVHPQGLGPTEAAKAWYMRVVEKMKWTDI